MGVLLAVWISLRLAFWQSPLMLERARSHVGFSVALEARPEGPATVARLERDFNPLVRIDLGRLDAGGMRVRLEGHDNSPSSASTAPQSPRRFSPARPQLSETPRDDDRVQGRAAVATMADPVFAPKLITPSRWLASSWLFWREDNQGWRQAATTPNYGRSQAGAVLAYQLAPDSAYRPQVYGRAVTALEGPREEDLAAGLSVRPVPDIPVRLAAEERLSLRDGANELRPAAFAVTEVPPFALPARLVGEAYAQAGWVGGDFSTGFVDGQLRITRTLSQGRDIAFSAGGGAWAGAQKGTRRLDIGPSVSASFRLSDDVYGRLAADYRVRVAGNAALVSGPALTLSAGF